jgi:hemolysin activation/secretion protein
VHFLRRRIWPSVAHLTSLAGLKSGICILVWSALTFPVLAQEPPSPGQILQQLPKDPPSPRPAGPGADIQASPVATPTQGGLKVLLKSIVLEGNSAFSAAELQGVVQSDLNTQVDLGGLQAIANKLTEFYREKGYAFARVIIPAQAINDPADIRMEVIEGRYGKVSVKAADSLAELVNPFIRSLQPDGLIQARILERTTLMLNDLPGIRATPVIRPGTAGGTGDLEYVVRDLGRFSGDIGVDNHGGRYTGEHRLLGGFEANRMLTLGDEMQLRGMITSQTLWFASGAYSFPINASSLRARLSASRTSYEIGKELKPSQIKGTAETIGVGLSYPLVRSQPANLTLSVDLQDRRLTTEGAQSEEDKKTASLRPVSLQFDRSDSFGGGGVLFGALTRLEGDLKLGLGLDPFNTAGKYTKTNLDLYRLQKLTDTVTLYGRYSRQWANKNLDSSEDLGLGGPSSVRAYPSGEGGGDVGWLAQLELRIVAPHGFAPYLFFDAGSTKVNAKPAADVRNIERSIEGAGLGLRYSSELWSFDASVAKRTKGGPADTDKYRDDPGIWFTLTRKL